MNILHIYISDDHNFYGRHNQPAGEHPMIEVTEAECVAGKGITGDRFFDYKPDYKGQITFFSQEVYEDLCRSLNLVEVLPSVFRRNVIVEGVDLNELIGKEFEIQGIRFLGTVEATPCYWMNGAVAEGAEKAMKGRGGLRAKILTSGTLRA
ncbi:MAG: MOSC domain-containing protein [Verrucomicrobiaceae bacterium]|nr:MOSC domain-containing protein [Verrucomicrobiaceae bacterium]